MSSPQLPLEQTHSGAGAVAGFKRKASSASSGSFPKRSRTGSGLGTLPDIQTQPIHHCPVCHRPCWFCQASSVSEWQQQQEEEEEEEEKKEEKGLQSQQERGEESMPPERSSASTSNLSKASSGKRKRADGRIFLTPKERGFEDNILLPCGIEIVYTPKRDVTPDLVFEKQPEVASSGLLPDFDETQLERFANELFEYERGVDDENALVAIYSEQVLPREPKPSSRGPIATISVRKDRWKPHKPGPTIRSNLYFFDWDVEPDVTYAVSMNQFDLSIRKRLRIAPLDRWLAERDASCPYLTIEYKCGGKSGKKAHAVNQNTCASAIWLHQRRTIRQDLGLSITDLRHYSVILMDGHYEVWEARYEAEGFLVQMLAWGDLKKDRDLKEYVRWSNAIHTWGLGPNAASFKEDILELLKRLDEGPPLTPKSLQTDVQATETRLVSLEGEENGDASLSSAPPVPPAPLTAPST